MISNKTGINWIFSKNFNLHFFFLNFNKHIKLAQDGLNSFISALIIVEKLLKILQGISQFGFMNERQFIELCENNSYLIIYMLTVVTYCVKCFFQNILKIFLFLTFFFFVFNLNGYILLLVYILFPLYDFKLIFQFFKKLVKIFFNVFHFLNFVIFYFFI